MNDMSQFRGSALTQPALLADLGHEMRTPLHALLGLLERTLHTRVDSEQRDYLEVMKSTCTALLALVNNTLDHTRLEAGECRLEQVSFSLRTMLDEVMKMFSCTARQKGLQLAWLMGDSVPETVIGDPLRLRQILVNLVGNAIKFTAHGQVLVQTQWLAEGDGNGRCLISVADTGIGIAPARQGEIFLPFRQGGTDTCRHYGGSGLGLSISARLVALMGGEIGLDSRPGVGSTFHFTARLARPAPGADAGPPPPPHPMTVLLVEDDATSRQLARWALEEAGHRVLTAATGRQARAQLRRQRPDVILLDLHLPDMDGFRAAQTLRRELRHGPDDIPLIALTAARHPDHPERCRRAGMHGCLEKPLDLAALYGLLRTPSWPGAHVGDVLNPHSLLTRAAGNHRLLSEIQRLFLRDCGPLMTRAQAALDRADGADLVHCLHTLTSLFGSLGADAARRTASRLESLAETGEAARVAAHFDHLAHKVDAVESALAHLVNHSQRWRRPRTPPLGGRRE